MYICCCKLLLLHSLNLTEAANYRQQLNVVLNCSSKHTHSLTFPCMYVCITKMLYKLTHMLLIHQPTYVYYFIHVYSYIYIISMYVHTYISYLCKAISNVLCLFVWLCAYIIYTYMYVCTYIHAFCSPLVSFTKPYLCTYKHTYIHVHIFKAYINCNAYTMYIHLCCYCCCCCCFRGCSQCFIITIIVVTVVCYRMILI